MADFAALILADGQTTPANHTFNRAGSSTLPGGAQRFEWRDTSVNGGLTIGANRASLIIRPPSFGSMVGQKGKAGASRQNLTLEGTFYVPTMEVITGANASGYSAAPSVACEDMFYFRHVRAGRSSVQASKDVVAFTRAFLIHALYTDAYQMNSYPA